MKEAKGINSLKRVYKLSLLTGAVLLLSVIYTITFQPRPKYKNTLKKRLGERGLFMEAVIKAKKERSVLTKIAVARIVYISIIALITPVEGFSQLSK